jgi:hypothetical protein
MAIFEKEKLQVISEKDLADLSQASINKALSVVDFNDDNKFFYITIDRLLFSNPVDTIKSVLKAHGFVPNLENILSCLDSFVFSVHASSYDKGDADSSPTKVREYFPCIRFELPQKHKVGEVLQSFYDEIGKYESALADPNKLSAGTESEARKNRNLRAELEGLKQINKQLGQQVSDLTYQLSREQKSLSRASRALDSQRILPDNAKICRVEQVDLKRRIVKIKSHREIIELPTHLLDRVPGLQARCLITFDQVDGSPVGIIFFDNEEFGSLEKRTADVLYVEGRTFKARDSMRNEFQIRALNDLEAATIASLRRGMKALISIADGYVVRFSVLAATDSKHFNDRIQEQLLVFGLARNQLVDLGSNVNKEEQQIENNL